MAKASLKPKIKTMTKTQAEILDSIISGYPLPLVKGKFRFKQACKIALAMQKVFIRPSRHKGAMEVFIDTTFYGVEDLPTDGRLTTEEIEALIK